MPPDPNVKAGVAAWIRRGNDVLMLFRENNSPEHAYQTDGSMTWAPPGGWIDHGETHFETAIREAKEEVGLDVVPTGQVRATTGPSDDGTFTVVCLFVECRLADPSQEPRNLEPHKASAVEWMPLDGLRDIPLFHNVERYLDSLEHTSEVMLAWRRETPDGPVRLLHAVDDHELSEAWLNQPESLVAALERAHDPARRHQALGLVLVRIDEDLDALVPVDPDFDPDYVEIDLDAREPVAQCDRCGRKTYDPVSINIVDRMMQPSGSACGGTFKAIS